MKHGSPLESPKDLFHQNQQSKCLQVPRINPNVIRNLGVNFEDLMPAHSDPTSPNFQKINDLLKSPSFVGSRPISMILPEFSQNSCIIPLPDNCLETSMPFEDLVGQLESPKLSDKMQMIFNSNVNLSESIMKNTFRAVDESRVKLEDKDLQVELEIRELKLHHLQKRVEGCLASSKNTLALNAQLSQNVSRMVSPTKSTNDVLSSNIKRRTSSRLHSPAGNIENSPAPVNYQLASSRSDTSSTSKARPKSVNHTTDRRQEEIKDRSFPTIKDNYGENEIAPQEESPNFKRDGRIIEREVTSASDKNVRSVSLPPKDFNSHSNHSIINEAYQKLSSYYDPRDTKNAELSNQVPQPEIGLEAVKVKSSHHKSTESIASNNITFYTNLPDKDAQIDGEEQNRILTRLQSNDCLSEDQESAQRSQFLFHSKSRETISAPLERKMNNMPREISLIDADGKERIFTIRPKELLSFQKLETICIAPLENKGLGFTKHRIRSQLSSFQLSETEEFSQLNEHLKSTQDQPIVGLHSKKASFYDNSNIASMNLDKHEYKTSGFCTAAQYEPQSEIDDLSNQKDFYAENLKSQIFNHPKCQKFFKREDLKQSNGESIGNNYLNIPPQENEGLEFYFKQKIQDCREFLDEVEKFLPTGSPIKESLRKRKKVRTAVNEELPRSNRDYETARKGYSENVDLEIKTVDNTPRVPTDENIEFMRVKHNTSTKKAFSEVGYLTEQSPQNNNINIQNKNAQFESDNEFVPKQLFKENNENPYSVQTNYIVRKPSSSSNIESIKKKTKSMKNANQKQGASKTSKVGKNHRSIAFPLDQNSEPVKKKTHDKTSSMKSPSQQISSKKSREIVSPGFVEIKKPKDKNLLRASSKSNVEIINLAKAQPRTNGVFIISQGH